MPFALGKIILLLLIAATVLLSGQQATANPQFPVFPVIKKNVAFWEKIYSTYTSSQGILHDKDYPEIIYSVVDLVDWNSPYAAKINNKLIQLARHKYKQILSDLANGRPPRTGEGKRIAGLFKHHRHHSYRRAKESIRLQIGQKDHFLAGVIRSGRYMPSIQRILKARGLPLELAYLAHVESSFNPKAHSKASAVGLWQFTKSTGRDFMTINDVLDERYDPYVSTRAAAKFLQENYHQLGSWPLALTAYNYGRAGMIRAQRQKGSYEKIFKNHNTKLFKFASRNFYSEFLAALRVARRLERDPAIIKDRPQATATLKLKGFASARDLRRYFAVSSRDFALLNPALRKPVLEGKKYVPKGYILRLPATGTIRRKIQTVPKRLFHKRQIRGRVYTVKKGDTATSIAGKYNVSLKELLRNNRLNRKATIRIGQKLKIPGHGVSSASGKYGKIPVLQATAKHKP